MTGISALGNKGEHKRGRMKLRSGSPSAWSGTMLLDALTAFFIMLFAFVLLLTAMRSMASLGMRLEGYNQVRLETLRSGILLPDGTQLSPAPLAPGDSGRNGGQSDG